jgi:hypothetical protein
MTELRQTEGEPEKTIYGPEWRAAMLRLRRLPREEDRAAATALVGHVGRGWEHLRSLQNFVVESRQLATGNALAAAVLDFIESYVLDTFHGIAADVAELIPGGTGPTPALIELEGEAAQFHTFLTVLRVTSDSPTLPAPLTATIRAATAPLLTWGPELYTLAVRFYPPHRGGSGGLTGAETTT